MAQRQMSCPLNSDIIDNVQQTEHNIDTSAENKSYDESNLVEDSNITPNSFTSRQETHEILSQDNESGSGKSYSYGKIESEGHLNSKIFYSKSDDSSKQTPDEDATEQSDGDYSRANDFSGAHIIERLLVMAVGRSKQASLSTPIHAQLLRQSSLVSSATTCINDSNLTTNSGHEFDVSRENCTTVQKLFIDCKEIDKKTKIYDIIAEKNRMDAEKSNDHCRVTNRDASQLIDEIEALRQKISVYEQTLMEYQKPRKSEKQDHIQVSTGTVSILSHAVSISGGSITEQEKHMKTNFQNLKAEERLKRLRNMQARIVSHILTELDSIHIRKTMENDYDLCNAWNENEDTERKEKILINPELETEKPLENESRENCTRGCSSVREEKNTSEGNEKKMFLTLLELGKVLENDKITDLLDDFCRLWLSYNKRLPNICENVKEPSESSDFDQERKYLLDKIEQQQKALEQERDINERQTKQLMQLTLQMTYLKTEVDDNREHNQQQKEFQAAAEAAAAVAEASRKHQQKQLEELTSVAGECFELKCLLQDANKKIVEYRAANKKLSRKLFFITTEGVASVV